MKIKTGDFIVRKDRWRIEACEAIKVTSKLVFWQSEHYGRPFRVRLDDVVFAGSESDAKKLAQQLTSSQAQQFDEERAARDRRLERDRRLITHATVKASPIHD